MVIFLLELIFWEVDLIYCSTNNGSNWDKINNGFPVYADGTSYLTVLSLATSVEVAFLLGLIMKAFFVQQIMGIIGLKSVVV